MVVHQAYGLKESECSAPPILLRYVVELATVLADALGWQTVLRGRKLQADGLGECFDPFQYQVGSDIETFPRHLAGNLVRCSSEDASDGRCDFTCPLAHVKQWGPVSRLLPI